jgi:hypothetical protein
MLADAPWPHGSGANLAVVGTLSEGFGRIVTSPPYLVGYVRWDARSDRFTSLLSDNLFQQLYRSHIDDESSHPEVCSEVAGGVTRNIVCLFREPDAGNLPVRFDEREQETEPSQTGLRWRGESHVEYPPGDFSHCAFSTLLPIALIDLPPRFQPVPQEFPNAVDAVGTLAEFGLRTTGTLQSAIE